MINGKLSIPFLLRDDAMLLSQTFLPMVKETPADAELVSHQLMLRAGLIRKLASGMYTWLPLGMRVLQKVQQIVREEMNRAGAQEMLFPSVQPAELWQESKRWDQYGKELLRFQDRHERWFCYGPTHEEVVTDVIRGGLNSYKQLPLNVYQIQTKFRDEIRPRFGVMRGREFIMKDAYSFHIDQASLDETYHKMHEAYCAILTRLGLEFRAVLADSGSIGGSLSHEFQVLAQAGEDVVVYSDESDYAANLERASSLPPEINHEQTPSSREKFATPNVKTIADLAKQHHVQPEHSVKTLIVHGEEQPFVALIIRGDHDLNEIKADKHPLVKSPLTFAADAEIETCVGAKPGSLGPVDLALPLIVDFDAAALTDFVCGANENEFHLRQVNWNADASWTELADLRNVVEGDASPDGKGQLRFTRGIEVGHIFQLGDKYAEPMQLKVLAESGKAVVPVMGCYGMGITRIVAAAIEQHHDANGICWPSAMAPFHIVIVPMQMHKSYRVREVTEQLYEALKEDGFEVLLDDRKDRPGVKFATADLIGIPHRLVVSERGLDQGNVEYKARSESESQDWPIEEVVSRIKKVAC